MSLFYPPASVANDWESAPDLEPWEEGVRITHEAGIATGIVGPQNLFKSASVSLIRYYQRRISINSVSRCPFVISCSNFALRAIERHGFVLGTCLFLDRYFYRENPQMRELYPLSVQKFGILRLDDTFYLDPDSVGL